MNQAIKIRGIYTTAFTRLLLDSGYRIADHSPEIRQRFKLGSTARIPDILLKDREDHQGVDVIGEADGISRLLKVNQEHLMDAALMHFGPPDEEKMDILEELRPSGELARAWLELGGASKGKLDDLRSSVIPTLARHHRLRIVQPGILEKAEKNSRVTNKLHGRVTRLLVTPLLRSLERLLGHLPFLVFLDSFRYPLAGEFSMITDLARINRIPWDWGLEAGVLSEVFRNCSLRRICQVDLTENYEHKHQELSPDDPNKGLLRMSIDIAKNLFRNLASEGIDLSESLLKTLRATYLRTAQETITKYDDDADINGLDFDRHEEGVAVETFTKGIELASKAFVEDPLSIPLIPNWNRVTSAIPDFLDRLRNAVDDDNT